jgi:hypothetical protein
VKAPLILGKPMRRRGGLWSWRVGCVSVEIYELDCFTRVFVYGEHVLLAYETTPARAAALVTRKLRQIHLCLTKVIGS